MRRNIFMKIVSIITILIIAMPNLSYASTVDKSKNPLEYKAIKEIEKEEQEGKYLEIALNIIEEHLGITKSELSLKGAELDSLYEYIDNAYKLKLSEDEFSSNIVNMLLEQEVEESPKNTTKNLFKYFLIVFFVLVAIISASNYILFKVRQIKIKSMRK